MKLIALWRGRPIASDSPRLTYTGHTDTVWSVAWSPAGKCLAEASSDTTLRVQLWLQS